MKMMKTAMKPHISGSDNPIGERLRMEMKKHGVTSADLAKRADVKMSFLYDIISGKSANPSTVKLARVAEVLGVNLDYLVGSSNNPSPAASTHGKHMGLQEYVSISRISVSASAAGGTLVTQAHETESYHFRKSWIREHLHAEESDLRMMYVRGDSMEPTLCNDDLILVDTSKKFPTPPGIFLLFDGFGLVAKRLELIDSASTMRIRIMSDNLQYQTYERDAKDANIIGRVVWFAREI
jgi:phage repressor protein C with HTH and peptisase S24 domain